MKLNYSIKICRISDIHTARFLARSGIDFLGLHAIFDMPNKKTSVELKKIIDEIRLYYPKTKTVLVTRITTPKKLAAVYAKLQTDFIQWSAPVSKSDKKNFLNYARKCQKNVKLMNVISSTETNILSACKDIVGNWVVIDKEFAGGSGTTTPKETLQFITKKLSGKKVLIAGGMGRVNISRWLKGMNVIGVDIMSSMEISRDNKGKDFEKIKDYLSMTRGIKHLPIFEQPRAKRLEIKAVTSIKGAMSAIKKGVDIIQLKKLDKNSNIITEIRKINQFVPIEITTP